jgi:hypothetical protein
MLASVYLLTHTVTKSQHQRMDKEWRACLVSCCEKILIGTEAVLAKDFFTVFSVTTNKSPVVKKANLHNALCRCCLSLLVAVNILKHSDPSFNSVHVPQSTSNHHHTLLKFRIGNLISCLLLTAVSLLFSKENQAGFFFNFVFRRGD